MKQQLYQQFVYKIESERILSAKCKNFVITPKEARREGLIISLADSALLRMLDKLNGVDRQATATRIEAIRDKINVLNNSKGVAVRNERRRLYRGT